MGKAEDLSGRTFGRLLVIEQAQHRFGRVAWLCQCACGNYVTIIGQNLRNGNSKSCGCLNREKASERTKVRNYRHGLTQAAEYYVWNAMIERCTRTNNRHFRNYGARGITVCGRWMTFSNFIADMGMRPSPTHTLERVDNDGNYSKENCIWLPRRFQVLNQRRTLRHNGLRGADAICRYFGVSKSKLDKMRKSGEVTLDSDAHVITAQH